MTKEPSRWVTRLTAADPRREGVTFGDRFFEPTRSSKARADLRK